MHTAAIQFIPKARGRILHYQELSSAGYSKLSEKGVGSFRYLPIQSAINSCCCHDNLASTVNTAGLTPIIMVVGASTFSTVICLRRMLPLRAVESIYVAAMVTFHNHSKYSWFDSYYSGNVCEHIQYMQLSEGCTYPHSL